jgi:PIN domain nuclease of toxin-antitoxin system
MNLLLDTHVLLWYLAAHPKLSERHKLLIEDRRNAVSVSVASLWEMTIKASLGKLELLNDPVTIESILTQQGIRIVPIQAKHLQQLLALPFHQRDPFDRLIIALAVAENMTLMSDDGQFSAYPVNLLVTE